MREKNEEEDLGESPYINKTIQWEIIKTKRTYFDSLFITWKSPEKLHGRDKIHLALIIIGATLPSVCSSLLQS